MAVPSGASHRMLAARGGGSKGAKGRPLIAGPIGRRVDEMARARLRGAGVRRGQQHHGDRLLARTEAAKAAGHIRRWRRWSPLSTVDQVVDASTTRHERGGGSTATHACAAALAQRHAGFDE